MSLFGKRGPSEQEMAREMAIKRSITNSFALALKSLQQQYVHSEQPIYSEDTANMVCNVLEAVFIHGLKSSFSTTVSSFLIGSDPGKTPQPVFWELVMRFTHKDTVSQLNHLGQVTTQIGMCRAWVRIALNDGVMESYLDAMLADNSSLRHFYKNTAYLRDAEQPEILKTYLQGLNNFNFALSYNSSMLNIWTTTPLVLAGLMEPTLTPQSAMSPQQAVSNKQEDVSNIRTEPLPVADATPIVVHSSSGHQGAKSKASRSTHGLLLPSTPPNTPYGASQLTPSDIDEIRKMTMNRVHSSGSFSTPTSQISCPDPIDHRTTDIPSFGRSPRLGNSPMSENGFPAAGGKRLGLNQDREVNVIPEDVSLETGSEESPSCGAKDLLVPNMEPKISDTCMSDSDRSKDQTPAQPNEVDPEDSPTDSEPVAKRLAIPSQVEHVNNDHVLSSGSGLSSQLDDVVGATGANAETVSENRSDQSGHTVAPNRPNSLFSAEGLKYIGPRRKSAPLEPVLTMATATSTFVEVATEVSPTMSLSPGSDTADTVASNNMDYDEGEMDIYSSALRAPRPQSNCLGSMTGWSSEFENSNDFKDKAPMGDVPVREQTEITADPMPPNTCTRPNQIDTQTSIVSVLEGSIQESQSFDRLLQNYGMSTTPVNAPTMTDVLNTLPDRQHGSSASHTSDSPDKSASDESTTYEDYEVISANSSIMSKLADSRTQSLVAMVGEITTEKGLDFQNYQCNGCSRPVGMIYGKARTCTYDACYYCYECHENEEYHIPARIVHNWDYRKHKVANHTYRFLKQIEEDPLIDIKQCNPRLYEHVSEVNEVKELRQQLRFLKAYLFTCRQSVADDLRRQVWPKEYLYDNIHLYSLQDLLQIPSGQLAQTLRKVIKYACRHVYECRLCSQKGFICEICSNPKVIYPFQVEVTVKCDDCNTVFHRDCKRDVTPCPKCERRRQREMKLGTALPTNETVDYGRLIT